MNPDYSHSLFIPPGCFILSLLSNTEHIPFQFVLKTSELNVAFCLSAHQLKRIPPHCLEGLRGVYSQLEVFTCSKSLSSLEVLSFYTTSVTDGMYVMSGYIKKSDICVCVSVRSCFPCVEVT